MPPKPLTIVCLALAGLVAVASATWVAGGPLVERQSGLEASRVSVVYSNRLARCWAAFLAYVSGMNLAEGWFQCPATVNRCLVHYIQLLFDHKAKFYLARDTVCAVQHFLPDLRFRLHRAWDCVKSWKLQTKLSSRVPLPHFALEALCLKAWDMGLGGGSEVILWVCACVLLRVGFYGLLRSGELCALRRDCVSIVRLAGKAPLAIIAVIKPKTRAVYGRSQFVVIREPGTVLWLEWLCEGVQGRLKLWPSTPWRFRKILFRLLQSLGWEALKINLGSLRPGGATHYLLMGDSVQIIQHMGRWASEHSLHVYLQECIAIMVQAQAEESAPALLRQAVEENRHFLSCPPLAGWNQLFSRKRQWRTLIKFNK